MYKLLVFLLIFIISATSFADDNIITQNMPNSCFIDTDASIINDIHKMSAVWQPNSYTCASGYFLPANAIECVQCAPDHTCPGGTYFFDPEQPHGIEYNTTLSQNASDTCVYEYMWPDGNQTTFNAVWQINSYDCDSGYYLPADGVECATCPENTVCSGGTYTYSENTIQGITGCVTGYNLNNNVCVANNIDITWNNGDDSESTTTQCTYDGDIILPTPPEKVGYTFVGWKLITE